MRRQKRWCVQFILYFYLQYDTSRQIIFIIFFSTINIAFDKRKAKKNTTFSWYQEKCSELVNLL